jgi:hypothetical protein
MARSGNSFVGKWKILEWYPDGSGFPDWLVRKGADLHITADPKGTYILQWPDQQGGTCTIEPPLKYSNGQLTGSADSYTKITNHSNIPLKKGAMAAFGTDTKHQRLIVSLVGGIVDGDPGTFTAEARPGGEEGPGWLRWLRRLFHRRG